MTGTSREEFKGLYSDITEIGSGGGGVIFKAYHQRLQKICRPKENAYTGS